MPPLHPLIIHFPIALFIIAVLFDGITAFTQKTSLISATRLLYIFGYLGTLAALITGDMLKHQRAAVLPHTLLTLHEWLAVAFAVWFTVLLVVRLRHYWEPSKPYAAMAMFGVLLLLAVGHTGGSMAWPAFKSTVALGSPNVGSNTAGSNTGSNTGSNAVSSNAAGAAKSTTKNANQASAKSSTPSTQSNAGSESSAGSGSSASKGTTTTSGHGTASASTSNSSSSTTLIRLGQQYFVQDCQSCHSLGVAEQYYGHLSKSDWTRVVQTMQSYAGGAIPDSQAQAIIAYVSSKS